MFDINTAINTAIAAAVEQALIPLVTRIQALEVTVTVLETKLAEAAPAEQATPNALSAAAFVTYLDQQEWFWEKLSRFVAENGNITVDDLHGFKQRLADAEERLEKITTASDERVREIADAAIEEHCSTYDHDDYDSMYNEWGDESTSEYVKDDDLRGVVEEVMNNATFEVSVRL